jgi:hypothetical protein
MVYDAFEALGLPAPSPGREKLALASIIVEIERRFGMNPIGIWLATKENAIEIYCEKDEEPVKVTIPAEAVVLSDLEEDGAFFVWSRAAGPVYRWE